MLLLPVSPHPATQFLAPFRWFFTRLVSFLCVRSNGHVCKNNGRLICKYGVSLKKKCVRKRNCSFCPLAIREQCSLMFAKNKKSLAVWTDIQRPHKEQQMPKEPRKRKKKNTLQSKSVDCQSFRDFVSSCLTCQFA